MITRRLTEQDVEEFRAVRLRALREHPEAFGRSYEEAEAEPIDRMAERLRGHAENFTLGAYDGRLVGIVAFAREQGAKERHKGGIYSMYVAGEAQGRGIGRMLLEQALSKARQQGGLEQIRLTVVTANTAARALYESLGFTTYGIEQRALKIGEQYFDEELMVLRL